MAEKMNVLGEIQNYNEMNNATEDYDLLMAKGAAELDKSEAGYLPAQGDRKRPWDRVACILKRKLTLALIEVTNLRKTNEILRSVRRKTDNKLKELPHKSEKRVAKAITSKKESLGLQLVCPDCGFLFKQNSDFTVLVNCQHVLHKSCAIRWVDRALSCPQCGVQASRDSMVDLNFNRGWTKSILKN